MGDVPLLEVTNVGVCVWITTQCNLMRGVSVLEVTNVVFVCGPYLSVPLWEVSPYGRCPLTGGYKCSASLWTMSQCPLMGGVPLLKVTNVVFVCGS